MTPVKCAVWKRVSTDEQDSANQDSDLAQFTSHHGYTVAATYTLADSAWKDGQGGPEYQAAIRALLDAAHKGEFSVLVVWCLDRICRTGAEDTLRLIRKLREHGCILVSVRESWLNGSSEVQDVLVAFAGWMAQQESKRKSERVKAAIAKRKAAGLPVGRLPGSKDKAPRKRSGYVRAWEAGAAGGQWHDSRPAPQLPRMRAQDRPAPVLVPHQGLPVPFDARQDLSPRSDRSAAVAQEAGGRREHTLTTKTKGAKKPVKDPRVGTFAMWIETPFGPLYPCIRPPHTIEPGDDRTLQVRARRREYLEHFRTRWCPDAGPVLSGEEVTGHKTDYPYRVYCSPEQLALAVGRMIFKIDSEKFKPLVDGPEGLGKPSLATALHSVYNSCWSTQLKLSDGTSSYDRPTQLCSSSYDDWASAETGPDPQAPALVCRQDGHMFGKLAGRGKQRKQRCPDCGTVRYADCRVEYPPAR